MLSAIRQKPSLFYLGTLFLGVVVAYFIYCPALHFPFAHHDQYRYFVPDKSSWFNDSQFYWLMIRAGRPVAGLIEQVIFQHVWAFEDLHLFRAVAIGLIGGLIGGFALWLHRRSFSWVNAFCVSGAIFTLPALQNFVIMTNIANIVAIILAFAAYVLFNRYILLASICLLLSLFTYPVLAYFYLVPLAVELLFSENLSLKGYAQHLFFLLVHSLVYYLFISFLVAKVDILKTPIPEQYQLGLRLPSFDKLLWFCQEIYPRIANLWNIYATQVVAWVSTVVALVFFAMTTRRGVFVFASMLVMFLLANITYFFANHTLVLYRVFFVSSVLFLLICCASFKKLPRIFVSTALGGFFLIGAVTANSNVHQTALNALLEINYVATALRGGGSKGVHYILPHYVKGFNGQAVVGDEFNCPTTCWPWEVERLTDAVWAHVHPDAPNTCTVSFSYEGEAYVIDPEVLIVDMRNLEMCR